MKAENSPSTPSKIRRGSAAPGQHLGYTLQETLLARYLLDSPRGSSLSLEVIDDVGVELPDGSEVAVQAKSALTGNPISNRSIDFWKTLSNWLRMIADRKINLETTTFILYVSRPSPGTIAERFHSVRSEEEAKNALEEAKSLLWGSAPRYSARDTVPQSLAVYIDEVLSNENTPRLLTKFSIETGSGSPMTDLKTMLEKQFLAEGNVDEILPQILGWVRVRIALQLEQRLPAYISRDEFFSEINAFVRKISVRTILRSFARQPTAKETEAELTKTYVRQLRLINLEDDDVLIAVSDFLRASSDRVDWAKRGLVHESSFDELTDNLTSAWRNHRIGARARHPAHPINHGQSLYSDCMTHQTPLEGVVTQAEFIRGCFHSLADELTIGWHPDFKAKLTDPEFNK